MCFRRRVHLCLHPSRCFITTTLCAFLCFLVVSQPFSFYIHISLAKTVQHPNMKIRLKLDFIIQYKNIFAQFLHRARNNIFSHYNKTKPQTNMICKLCSTSQLLMCWILLWCSKREEIIHNYFISQNWTCTMFGIMAEIGLERYYCVVTLFHSLTHTQRHRNGARTPGDYLGPWDERSP